MSDRAKRPNDQGVFWILKACFSIAGRIDFNCAAFAGMALFFTLLTTACEPPETAIRLTSYERQQVDTLIRLQTDSLRQLTDSLCTSSKEQRINWAVDSIIKVRIAEEIKLRARKRENDATE